MLRARVGLRHGELGASTDARQPEVPPVVRFRPPNAPVHACRPVLYGSLSVRVPASKARRRAPSRPSARRAAISRRAVGHDLDRGAPCRSRGTGRAQRRAPAGGQWRAACAGSFARAGSSPRSAAAHGLIGRGGGGSARRASSQRGSSASAMHIPMLPGRPARANGNQRRRREPRAGAGYPEPGTPRARPVAVDHSATAGRRTDGDRDGYAIRPDPQKDKPVRKRRAARRRECSSHCATPRTVGQRAL